MSTEQISTQIARTVDKIVTRSVDKLVTSEVLRRLETIQRQQKAAAAAEAEIMAAAHSVGVWTDKVLLSTYSGAQENAHRKQLFAANERLAAVMRRHGRLK